MPRYRFSQLVQRNSFWLVFISHGLLLLILLGLGFAKLNKIDKPVLDVPPSLPAYVSREPSMRRVATKTQNGVRQKEAAGVTADADKKPDIKPMKMTNHTASDLPPVQKINQFNVVNLTKKNDPVHLIGDKHVDVPLLEMIGKALTARLIYPKIAVDFNVRGLVLVGFVIHPDGRITDTQLMRSSGAGVLDEEALRALRAIELIPEVNRYLQASRFMVVGILFGTHA